MAEPYTPNLIETGFGLEVALNNELEKIQVAFQTVLNKVSSSSNAMNVDLDMNGYRLLNVGSISYDGPPLEGANVAVVDAGDYYAGDNIEVVLQEIGAARSSSDDDIVQIQADLEDLQDLIDGLQAQIDGLGGGGGGYNDNVVVLGSLSDEELPLDLDAGRYFTCTMDSDFVDFTITNLPGAGKGATIMIQILTNIFDVYTITWPANWFPTTGSLTELPFDATDTYFLLAASTLDNGASWIYTLTQRTFA